MKKTLPNPEEEESRVLLEAGLDPSEWASARMLAEYWNLELEEVLEKKSQELITGSIIIEDVYFFPVPEVLTMWEPPPVVETKVKPTTGTRLDYGEQLPIRQEIESAYVQLMAEEVGPADWALIVRAAVEDALEGNRHARKWLSDYLIGTPLKRSYTKEVTEVRFSDEQRAAALEALMGGVIDVESEVGES